MHYISSIQLNEIFQIIYSAFDRKDDRVAMYSEEETGLKQIMGALERSMLTFYPDLFDKAAYLFININLGHFFSNGNKRLSLVTSLYFLIINGAESAQRNKKDSLEFLKETFPEVSHFEDYPDFKPDEFALYNAAMIIADHEKYGISHDELKLRITRLFLFFFISLEP